METIDSSGQQACNHCQAAVHHEDEFCGQCGKEIRGQLNEDTREDVFTILTPTFCYYFITFFLLATYKFTSFFPEGLNGLLIVTFLDILIVIAFWINNYEEIKPLFSLSRISISVMCLTIVGAIIGSVVVSITADLINLSFHDDVFYDSYLFQDTSYPLLFATLLIAVQPAIFEEVAFRGFLFNNLKLVSYGSGTVYITGFVFGIMHLQIISLLWLVPIGLAFGFLRNRYNTLWYGIVGHFTYNLFITLYEFKGWF